jgi:hypothetical protein
LSPHVAGVGVRRVRRDAVAQGGDVAKGAEGRAAVATRVVCVGAVDLSASINV